MRKLKEFRKKLGLTQQEMGQLFNLSRTHYGNIENGLREGKVETWLSIQKRFKLTNDETFDLFTNVYVEK